MNKRYDDINKDFTQKDFGKENVDSNPFRQFNKWINNAINSGIKDPTAMSLSTVGKNLKPSSRIVLLKEIKNNGFIFYTNYNSKKGIQIAENNYGSLLFFWAKLEQQIRIEGKIEKVTSETSDKYFQSRNENRKIGAWASQQSNEIINRKYLEEKNKEFERKFAGKTIQRPDNWGGYILYPTIIEFWQGRPNRLHDRIEFFFDKNIWKIRRLAP
ncbi:MAG: pyridoxamine 5'-phosphate oxidase [Bacteroidales bacterium]|nr:pyridoxamine 5'-phosphate oxidase [Bacteroidales bacterium]